jgi:deoxycytidylate deaminase
MQCGIILRESEMLSKSWNRGFNAAHAAALHSDGPTNGTRMGAALYAGSNLLSFGYNVWFKTNPNFSFGTHNSNTHAEAMCLVRRKHYDHSSNLILYVARTVTNTTQTKYANGFSKPCDRCMALIKLAGVRRVRYFDKNGEAVEIKL